MKTRTILASLITCSLSFSAYAATDWPTKPVEFVITASAGGDTDMNARLLAKYFKEVAGVPLVITNMPGSAGSIATTNVKNAAADGTKAVFCHTGHMVINKMTGIVDYNYKDFDIATIAGMNRTYVLTASKKSGINSLDDLIAKAKAEPGKVIYGTEFGGLTYTQGLKLEQMAGIKLKTVDAGTAADRVIGLLSGRIDLGVVAYSAVKDYQTTGKMTILAQGDLSVIHYLVISRHLSKKELTTPVNSLMLSLSPKAPILKFCKKWGKLSKKFRIILNIRKSYVLHCNKNLSGLIGTRQMLISIKLSKSSNLLKIC